MIDRVRSRSQSGVIHAKLKNQLSEKNGAEEITKRITTVESFKVAGAI